MVYWFPLLLSHCLILSYLSYQAQTHLIRDIADSMKVPSYINHNQHNFPQTR